METQFRLWQLFVFVTGVALVLGIGSRSTVAAAFACPMIVGGMIGAWRSRSWRGTVPGILAGYYWSLWSLLFFVVGIATESPWLALAAVFLTSVMGGYLGGVVESNPT